MRQTRGDAVRRKRHRLTLASEMALLSALLIIVALVTLGYAYSGDEIHPAAGRLGWFTLVASVLSGGIAVARGFVWPLHHVERRARQLASGLAVLPRSAQGESGDLPVLDAFNSVARRLNLLTEIAELLATTTERSAVLSGITAAMANMLDADGAGVFLLAGRDSLELVAAQGSLAGQAGGVYTFAELPWAAEALILGTPTTATPAPGYLPLLASGEGRMSVLVAPLQGHENSRGLAVVVREGTATFTGSELESVRSFAAQASVALRNAQLFEEERAARQEAEWLRSVAERAAAAGDPLETLEEIARMECELFGLADSAVVLYDTAQFGLPLSAQRSLARTWRSAWLAAGGLEPEATAAIIDTESAPRMAKAALREVGASGALVTPLYRGGALEGFLILFAGSAALPPEARTLSLAATVGRQASLVLENAYLYQQARRRADNLETIFRISHAVGSSLQSRIVLNRVMDVVQKILSADAVLLMQYDPQRRQIYSPMARGSVSSEMLRQTFRPGEDVPGRVFETHEPERYDHASSADTLLLNECARQGLESLLAVPLLARGRSLGVLVALACGPGSFTSEDMDLLRTFASQAALAIDTAELFSREHETVRVLQESILPVRLPRIDGLEAASIYLPGGSEAEIGGDYYDLFTLSDGTVVITMGDVCGKGVLAATKTSMIRHATRGMIIAGLALDRVLEELNAMLLEKDDQANSIVTLWLGTLDVGTGELTYVSGGHPAGLVMQRDRTIVRLGATGAILGAVSGAAWTLGRITLDPGAHILLYTDGVTEARRGTKFFGEGRVRRALRGGGDAAAVAQRLLAQVQSLAGGELRDDIAILALRYADSATNCQDVTRVAIGGK